MRDSAPLLQERREFRVRNYVIAALCAYLGDVLSRLFTAAAAAPAAAQQEVHGYELV